MKLKYKKSKGGRIKKGSCKFKGHLYKNFIGMHYEDHYFVYPARKWVHYENLDNCDYKYAVNKLQV